MVGASKTKDGVNGWIRTYGGTGKCVINDIKVLPNGDIIAVGYTNSTGTGGYDALVMKLSSNGSVIWAKTYGGKKADEASAVALTSKGDIVVAGWTESFGAGGKDAWVFELSQNGSIIWQRTYGGKKNEVARAVTVAESGDILVAGWSMSFTGPYNDTWVLKLSPNGSVMWTRLYKSGEEVKAIAATPDGNVVVAGMSWYGGLWVIKLDHSGRDIWQKSYMRDLNITRHLLYNENNEFPRANSVVVTRTGDIIVAGTITGFGAGGSDVWVLKLSPNGSVVWQKTYGSSADEGANALAVAPDGSIFVAGYSSFGSGGAWILRLTSNGSVVWTKFYEGNGTANAIALTKSGGVIVAGGSTHAWILKIPFNGKVNLPGLFTVEVPPMTPSCSVRNIRVEVGTMKPAVHPWNPVIGTQFSVSQGRYWAKTYWKNGDNVIKDVKVLPNGDIVAVGYTDSGGAGGYDALVMKLSPNGSVIWAKTYGGPNDDTANAVTVAPNGDVIVVGYTNSSGAGWDDVWVLRLSPSGEVIWAKTYGGCCNDVGTGVTVSPKGNIIVAGKSDSLDGDFWILKLAPNGSIIWQKTYSNPSTGSGQTYGIRSIAVTPDGYITVEDSGWWIIYKSNQKWMVIPYVWIIHMDPNGSVMWSDVYRYGNIGIRKIVSSGVKPGPVADELALTPGGNIVVVGYMKLNVTGERYTVVMAMKLAKNGSVMWAKTYGGAHGEASSVAMTANGDILVTGWMKFSGTTGRDALILKLNSSGNVIWQRVYRGEGDCWASSVVITKEGEVILAGGTRNPSQEGQEIWIMRLPSSGGVNLSYLASMRSVPASLKLNVTEIPVFEESLDGVQVRPSSFTSNAQVKSWSPMVSVRFSTAGGGSATKVLSMDHLTFHFLTPSNVTKRTIEGRTLYVLTFRYDVRYDLPPKELVVMYSSNVFKIINTLKIEKVVISRPPEQGVNHSVVILQFGGCTGTIRYMGNGSSPRYRLFFDVMNTRSVQSILYWLYENGVLHTVPVYGVDITPTNLINYLTPNDTKMVYRGNINPVDIAFGKITNEEGKPLSLKDILTSPEPLKGAYTIRVYVTVPSNTVLNLNYFKICVVERTPYQPIAPTSSSSSHSSTATYTTASRPESGTSSTESLTSSTETLTSYNPSTTSSANTTSTSHGTNVRTSSSSSMVSHPSSTSMNSTTATSNVSSTRHVASGSSSGSGEKSICGPAAIVGLSLMALTLKRK
ncbi:MAG: CGP-CTERM sorting domain-containing protein [Thermococci archaeon]|nr:CGP-CTERM sorting domain-containing protein [Thermococci archaeon]